MDSSSAAAADPIRESEWLQADGPNIIHRWCQQQAEPLLSAYLEQWMVLNATQLLTQISSKQQASLQMQIHQLQHQIAQQSAAQQQLQAQLAAHTLSHQHLPKHSPHSPTNITGSSSPYSPPGSLGLTRRTSPLALATTQPSRADANRAVHTSPIADDAHTAMVMSPTNVVSGVDRPPPPSAASVMPAAFPAILDVRTIMRNRLNSQAAAAAAGGAMGFAAPHASHPSAGAPAAILPPPGGGSIAAPGVSAAAGGLTMHRPLGLGFGRSSPEYFSSGLSTFPHLKGPIAEVLSTGESSPAPGEEVQRESSPSSVHHATAATLSPIAREASNGAVNMSSTSRRMSTSSATSIGGYEKSSGASAGYGGGGGGGGSGQAIVVSERPQGHVDILIVEDVRVAQKLAHAALTRAHYRVDIAGSGEVACDKFRQLQPTGCPRIILMDITLPGMSGVETTERIRKLEHEWTASGNAAAHSHAQTPHRPVWIYGLTGNVDPEDLARYRSAGMNGCILKGRLLADSVRAAVDENERHPDAFINLAEKGGDPPLLATTIAPVLSPSAMGRRATSNVTPPPPPPPTTPIPFTLPQMPRQRDGPTSLAPSPTPINAAPQHISAAAAAAVAALAAAPMVISSAPTSPLPSTSPPRSGSALGSGASSYTSKPAVEQVLDTLAIASTSALNAAQAASRSGVGVAGSAVGAVSSPTPDFHLLSVGGGGSSSSNDSHGASASSSSTSTTTSTASPLVPPMMAPMQAASAITSPATMGVSMLTLPVGVGGAVLSGVGVSSTNASANSSASASPMPLMMQMGGGPTATAAALSLVPKKLASLAATSARSMTTYGGSSPITPTGGGMKRSLATMESGALPPPMGLLPPHAASPTVAPTSIPTLPSPSTMGSSPSSSGATVGFDVLLVEDVRVAQRIAQRALQTSGYRVDVASSGESAIDRFKLHSDSLRIVLMDINLPGMSGTDATEVIRLWERDVIAHLHPHRAPVVVFGLTGNTDQGNLRLYEQAGMNGCIAKGTLLGQAVRAAMEAHARAPSAFVHLSSFGGLTHSNSPLTAGMMGRSPLPLRLTSAESLSEGESPLDRATLKRARRATDSDIIQPHTGGGAHETRQQEVTEATPQARGNSDDHMDTSSNALAR